MSVNNSWSKQAAVSVREKCRLVDGSYSLRQMAGRVQLKCDGTRRRTCRESEGGAVHGTLLRNIIVYPGLLRTINTYDMLPSSMVSSEISCKISQFRLHCFHTRLSLQGLTFRHRASCILGQAFHCSPENAFYIFNQQIYFII